MPGEIHPEGTRYQVEISTPIAHSAASLREELATLRRTLGRAARAHGCRLLAAPSPVVAVEGPLHLTDDEPRQREQHRRFGSLTDTLVSCGRHVHIGTLDVDTAVAVSNRVRPWLPTLIALAANSPFWGGRDTGHASWRAMAWSGWPSAGLPPHFTSTAHFRLSVQTLLGSGAALDTKMVYWDVRPSGHWPTLEVRAPDMSPDIDTAVLQGELVRALVTTALQEIAEQRPEPALRDDVLRLARWRAAHDGLEGFGLDPYTGAELPAADLAEALLDLVAPALAAMRRPRPRGQDPGRPPPGRLGRPPPTRCLRAPPGPGGRTALPHGRNGELLAGHRIPGSPGNAKAAGAIVSVPAARGGAGGTRTHGRRIMSPLL